MSYQHLSLEERFPAKDKSAANLDTQIAWLVEEMNHVPNKHKDYENQLLRFNHSLKEPQSLFGLLNSYWRQFRLTDNELLEFADQQATNESLQALAKVVAGLGENVALAKWLEFKIDYQQDVFDIENLICDAALAIQDETLHQAKQYSKAELEHFIAAPTFAGNPIGQATLKLHDIQANQPDDYHQFYNTALTGTGIGLLMWQCYAKKLQVKGVPTLMPKPGLNCGFIEAW